MMSSGLSTQEQEQGKTLAPRFDVNGLITAVATDVETGDLLMVAHMNAQALEATIRTGEAHYWSRSRQALWHKGATSGHTQKVVELRLDCDQDAVWLKVSVHGAGQCHVGYKSCFYRTLLTPDPQGLSASLMTVESKTYDPSQVYVGVPTDGNS